MRYLNRNIVSGLAANAVLFGLLVSYSGCGSGGGASAVPAVTIKPSGSGDSEATDGNGGARNETGGASATEGFGTLIGKVIFEGTAPSLVPLVKSGANIKDAGVCAANDIPNERILVDAGGGVANVFVYLAKAPKGVKVPDPPSEPAIFDQKGCKFFPHAMFVRAGQTLNVLSGDPIPHNTHTFPKKNSPSNAIIPANNRNGVDFTYQRSESEPIQVKCDYHAWMLAYHLPLDHPYAAVTKADGTFRIENVPAGTRKFRVWHEAADGGYLTRNLSVSINPDEETSVEFKFSATKLALHNRPDVKTVKLSALLNQ